MMKVKDNTELNLVEVKFKNSPSWRKTYTSPQILDDFNHWLEHECNNAEPTEELFDEFICLEVYVRPTLMEKVITYGI